jgi:hypothetical protein
MSAKSKEFRLRRRLVGIDVAVMPFVSTDPIFLAKNVITILTIFRNLGFPIP